MRQATRWGIVPTSGTYRLASGEIEPQTVSQIKQCLAEVGLQQSDKPRYFIELAHTVTPGRVVADGMAYDEPPPLVMAGKLRGHRSDREALTLVFSDFANDKDTYRVRLIERRPNRQVSSEHAIGATLCTFVRADQSPSS